ncbi:MAG: hypothetical protein OHK006_08950 [Thermodesulfovibrionales bacterium]
MTKRILYLVLAAFFLFSGSGNAASPELEQAIKDYNEESYEEAVDGLIKARQIEPQSSIAAYYLGLAYKQMQEYGNAVGPLLDATRLQPEIREGHVELIDVLLQLNRADEALEHALIAERQGTQPAKTAYLKGLVLAKKDRTAEAIASLEKSKVLDPSLRAAADFQIASLHAREGRLTKAKEVFRALIVSDPNTDLASYSQHYVGEIEKAQAAAKPFSMSVGARYEFDSNVISKPSDPEVSRYFIDRQRDQREVVTLQAAYNLAKEGSPFSLKTQYNFYLSNHHHIQSQNAQNHTLSLTPSYATRRGVFSLLTSYSFQMLDEKKDIAILTVNPIYLLPLTTTHMLQFTAKYVNYDYLQPVFFDAEDRDADEFGGGLGYIFFFKENKGFVNAKYEYNEQDTDGRDWDFRGHKAFATALYPFTPKLSATMYAEYYQQDYKNKNVFFLKNRRDKIYTGSAAVTYEAIKNLTFIAQYTYSRFDSNIAFYDYDREIISLGLEWRY